ncbi:MAG TPA: nuclear transport factor 2 family protein [Gemmatimonadaceae bacterium]
MRLYADTGPVISAASGGFTESRDSLERALTSFWTTAGQFMRQPTWTWGAMKVDVLSRNAAVVTARYTIPHWTPEGRPHVLGGAWTSVWARRGGRWMIVQEHLSDLPRPVAERVESTMPPAPPP